MSPYFKNFFLIGLFGMLILSVFMIYYFLKIEQLKNPEQSRIKNYILIIIVIIIMLIEILTQYKQM
ncbi:MAG: hypothetical protein ACP6IY_18175, partial [Promethearchaeia archaeon]